MMPSHYNLLVISFFISTIVVYGDNFTCYSCYYSTEHTEEWSKSECMDDPGKFGVSVVLPCRESFFCYIQETYHLVTKEVVEFSRSCGAVGWKDECTKDTYRVICRDSCKGNLCNKNDTANLHEIYFNRNTSNTLFRHVDMWFFVMASVFVCSLHGRM